MVRATAISIGISPFPAQFGHIFEIHAVHPDKKVSGMKMVEIIVNTFMI